MEVVLGDGDRVLGEIVRRGLARAGVRVHLAPDGADVPAQAPAAAPETVLLGRGVADVDGGGTSDGSSSSSDDGTSTGGRLTSTVRRWSRPAASAPTLVRRGRVRAHTGQSALAPTRRRLLS